MITPELIARINELARKKRREGLSAKETAEQVSLRRVYLDSIREQMKDILDSIEVMPPSSEGFGRGFSKDMMDFQEELRRPFADTEHIH